MTLQASGQISMDDIATEFGDTAPHNLSDFYRGAGIVGDGNTGVPTTGTITIGDFYGATGFTPYTLMLAYAGVVYVNKALTRYNTCTRINSNGAQVGSDTSVGTARSTLGGAAVIPYALYWGGQTSSYVNTCTRITSSGASAGSQTAVGAITIAPDGATADGLGVFYGTAYESSSTVTRNMVHRINASGVQVGSVTNVGTARGSKGSCPAGSNALYFGGINSTTSYNTITRINFNGAIVGSETSAGTARSTIGGAPLDQNTLGVFVGGLLSDLSTFSSLITRINSNGAQVGSESSTSTTLGNTVEYSGAADSLGIYAKDVSTVVRVNSNGAQVGSATSVSFLRSQGSGASTQ